MINMIISKISLLIRRKDIIHFSSGPMIKLTSKK